MVFDWWREVNDGLLVDVKRAYWTTDGKACIELTPFVIDPSEQMEKHLGGSMELRSWWSKQDGDLEENLKRGGWS